MRHSIHAWIALMGLWLTSAAFAQSPANESGLLDSEQLAARALSITVGVEISAQTPKGGLPGGPPEPNTADKPLATPQEALRQWLAGVPSRPDRVQLQLASGTLFGDGSLVITAGLSPSAGDKIRIKLPDGRTVPGTLIARDESGLVSICRMQQPEGAPLPVAEQQVRAGQPILAAQYAGEGDFTVRVGIISAPERMMHPRIGPWIQTDIPTEVGAAGGPILNQRGEVVGIFVASKNVAEGPSFAIPASTLTRFLKSFDETAGQQQDVIVLENKTPWLGVGLSSGQDQPLTIDVYDNTPAAKAGLQDGDVLVAIDGAPVHTAMQVQRLLRRHQQGDRITICYVRGKEPASEVTVQLEAMPKSDVAVTSSSDVELTETPAWDIKRLNNNLIIAVPDPNRPEGSFTLRILPQGPEAQEHALLAPPAITLSRSDQDQKLDQLSKQLDEMAKQLSALAESVKQLREQQPEPQTTRPEPPKP